MAKGGMLPEGMMGRMIEKKEEMQRIKRGFMIGSLFIDKLYCYL